MRAGAPQVRLVWLLIPLAAGGLAACARKASDPSSFSTGLNVLEKGDARLGATVDAEPEPDPDFTSRLDLMEQAQRHGEVSVDARPARSPRPRKEAGDTESPGSGTDDGEQTVEPVQSSASDVDSNTAGGSPASREALVAELAAQLREQARTSSAPAAALLQLAVLELLEPQAIAGDRAAEAALTPQEAEFLKAWRDVFAAAREGLTSSGDIGPLASKVTALAERVQAAQPLSVIESRLCLRVDGFGMFDELPRRSPNGPYIFTGGRRARAVVYVELANFLHSTKQQQGVDGFEVRLAQDLTLFHAAKDGDTIVWRRPFQDIHDFSRKRRRDFFTTQVIDLPATLGVGSYRMKITVNDKSSGASAETIIPIEFVAEPIVPAR